MFELPNMLSHVQKVPVNFTLNFRWQTEFKINTLKLLFKFTKLFKSAEGDLLKLLRQNSDYSNSSTNENIIGSYKKLIKKQDEEIAELKQQLKQFTISKIDRDTSIADSKESNEMSCNGVHVIIIIMFLYCLYSFY